MSLSNPYLDALSEDVFDERPVDLDTFLYDDEFLGKTMGNIKLSPIQKMIVELGSQIYKEETLIELYGTAKGRQLSLETVRNLLLMLGKGSGKDFISKIICCYIVHKLLCLKDPSGYYGKPSDETVEIVNLALNADQAFRVFFSPLKKMIKKSSWLSARLVDEHAKDVEFDKNVFIYSLHSKFEGAEGFNLIAVVLDEIDGFEVEGYSEAVYTALHFTVLSRFPEYGKVICLSFPRSKDRWMFSQYEKITNKVESTKYEHVFKINETLPDGIEDNEFTVSWYEDEVISYTEDNWFALKAPTFRVNPSTHINSFKSAFLKDIENNTSETLLRICANPPDHSDSVFFRNQANVAEAFNEDNLNLWDESTQTFVYKGDPDKEYFIHVDLSKVSDRTVVALGHVSHWQQVQVGGSLDADVKPVIVIDLFRVWEPTSENHIDNMEVVNFIYEIAKIFMVSLVTFDRWGSIDLIKYLNDRGIDAERQSLDRASYMEFRMAVDDHRLKGPYDKRLAKEMKNLIINKVGKVDHPDGKEHYNDISEAVCGVINNCVSNALEDLDVTIVSKDTVKRDRLTDRERRDSLERDKDQVLTDDLMSFIQGIGGI